MHGLSSLTLESHSSLPFFPTLHSHKLEIIPDCWAGFIPKPGRICFVAAYQPLLTSTGTRLGIPLYGSVSKYLTCALEYLFRHNPFDILVKLPTSNFDIIAFISFLSTTSLTFPSEAITNPCLSPSNEYLSPDVCLTGTYKTLPPYFSFLVLFPSSIVSIVVPEGTSTTTNSSLAATFFVMSDAGIPG